MQRPRRLFTFLLPVIWAITNWVNFLHPGDEYGGWAGSSLPGLWILPLIDVGHPRELLPFVLIAGAMTMAIAGAVLDWLQSPWWPWYGLWVISAGVIFVYSLSFFPSLDRAIAKNGSIQAYLLPASSLGLMISTIVLAIATGLWRLATCLLCERGGSERPAAVP